MLLPEEVAALHKAESRVPRNRVIVLIVTLLVMFIPLAVYLPGEGHVDHLLGRDEEVMAVVDSVNTNGSCRKPRRTRYVIEVSWTTDSGTGRDSYSQCGNPPVVGSSIPVWVGPSGNVSRNSPAYDRIGLSAISLGLAIMAAGIGFAIVIVAQRHRRRLLTAGVMPLSAPTAVEVSRGPKSAVLMRHMANPPQPPGRNTQITVVLHTRQGSPPTSRAPRDVVGTWWLYVAPPVHKTKRTGLLYRGQERCWIDFRPR